MRIELPYPDSRLTPNAKRRSHWRTYQPVARKARIDAAWATLASEGFHDYEAPQDGPIPLCITFYPPDARKRDLDGALGAAKHALDGIADALDVNDNRFTLSLAFGKPEKPGRIEVTL